MSSDKQNRIVRKILEEIELPDSAYETAEKRYRDLGAWLHREGSNCAEYQPQVSAQGSFRLGTAIRPAQGEEYDLDMSCNLRDGLTKSLVTQKDLKSHVGVELERYRTARCIKEELSEKRRCWRLEYADGMSFHMDVVPCIPEQDTRRGVLKQRMVEVSNFDEGLAQEVSELAVSITDNEDPEYDVQTQNWRVSNPEGFAKWFESRMRMAKSVIHEREMTINASIDDLPYYRWKTPLQSAIQLLKRHRDTMFKDNEDSKPISIIITTLAARAYNGETDVISTLEGILKRMGSLVNSTAPYVPNPINPDEDFGDKWDSPEHQHLKLKESFQRWILQTRSDFKALTSRENAKVVVEAAQKGFSVNLNKADIAKTLGIAPSVAAPISRIEASENSPRPWCAR